MIDYSIKNIRFDFNKIRDILDNCLQLDKVGLFSDECTSLVYFDVMTGIKYIISSENNTLEIISSSKINGKFDETEYILRVLRAVVQNSHLYEKNCFEADNNIISILGQKISPLLNTKYSY